MRLDLRLVRSSKSDVADSLKSFDIKYHEGFQRFAITAETYLKNSNKVQAHPGSTGYTGK